MFDIDKALVEIKTEKQCPDEPLREKTRQLVMKEVQKKQKTKHFGRVSWAFSAVIAVIAAFIILFSLPHTTEEVSYYTIDINPSISMQVNASGTVLGVSAENEDAQVLLRNMELAGLSFEAALMDVVQKADELGYLKDDAHVLVAHFGETECLTQQQVECDVSESTNRNVNVLLLQGSEEDYEQSKAQNQSPGVELLIKQAADQGIQSEDVDELVKQMSGNANGKSGENVQNALDDNSEKANNSSAASVAANNEDKKNENDSSGNSENAQSPQTTDKTNGQANNETKVNNSNNENKNNSNSSSNGQNSSESNENASSSNENQNTAGSDNANENSQNNQSNNKNN